jgi:hypothetical protein
MAGSSSDIPVEVKVREATDRWKYDRTEDGAPRGVWVVWYSFDRQDGLAGIWAEEIEALRFINDNGYGKAEFVEFGELV